MSQPVYLLVDNTYANDVGGYTTDSEKIDYNLQALLLKKKLQSHTPSTGRYSIFAFPAGRYVMILQYEPTLTNCQMAFIHFELSIDDWFDHFADTLTPKTIQGIFETQQKIKARGTDFQQTVVLTTEFPSF